MHRDSGRGERLLMKRFLMILIVLLLNPSLALAREHDRRWVDLSVGTHLALADSAELHEENDRLRISTSAGFFVRDNLTVGIRGRFGVPAGRSESYEAMATTTFSFLRVPLANVFAGAGLGYYWREVRGSDWVFHDDGFTANLDVGLSLAFSRWIAPAVVFTYALSHSKHNDINSSYPAWTHGLLAGVTLSFSI
jgi:hypothetical protein